MYNDQADTLRHSRLTEFFVNRPVLSFISQGKQSDESTWRRMSVPSRNFNKYKEIVYCYFCILLTLSLQCCCYMFTCLSPFFTLMLLLPVYLFLLFFFILMLLLRVPHVKFFFQQVLISWILPLSSCLIWQIIRFIHLPNEYGCIYAWTTLGSGPAVDLQKMSNLEKIDESYFDLGGYVNKQKTSEFWSSGIIGLFWARINKPIIFVFVAFVYILITPFPFS